MQRTIFSILIACSTLITFGQNPERDISELDGRGEDLNIIDYVVPFITITPDSRAGAMGDIGAATSADVNSIYWNPAKYAFMDDDMGASLSYTPWLKNIGADINLANLGGFVKLDDMQAVGFSLNYFNLGSITITDENAAVTGEDNPNELALSAAYSRRFSEKIGGSVGLKFISSRIFSSISSSDGTKYIPGRSVAADIAVYYEDNVALGDKDGEMGLGMNISNIGNKMGYTEGGQKNFIPTTLRLGGRLTTYLDEYNSIGVSMDLSKLLVPTPDPTKGEDQFDDVSVMEGIFRSFGDAPGGFEEEMREIMIGFGAEYWYANQFAVRGGTFLEHQSKGNRKYATIGVGLKLNMLHFDFAYLLPFDGNSPLQNTLRLTLGATLN